ncbi:MAG: efflux RND transporter periplasmic adaptor subunit [Rhodospirillales bacterium CG15_BIG_FIL_POST_REV_8_21_14_020_66_15]|nr:MAG: efflux RND transporter periplasmic adaptor subunit [Rhodospirillales bacterium CG15_BIG_FIL_POST_REV_8_21_14_020_66_15]
MRKALFLIAAALAAAGAWWGISHVWRPVVDLAPVERGPAVRAVYATGNVEPVQWARITPLVQGRIEEIFAFENARVAPGELLARLDEAEIRATVKELEARRDYLAHEVERTRALLTKGHGTEKAYELALSEYQQVLAAIAAANARRDHYVLRAPIGGVVLRRDGEIGEVVNTTSVMYWIGQPRPLRIEAEVDEEDIARVAVGQTALIKADAFPGRDIFGTVAEITPKGDPVNKSYRVRVALPDDTPLMIGMTTELNIVVERHEDAALVPETAVQEGRLWTVTDGRATAVQVSVGIHGNGKAEVAAQGGALPDKVIRHPPAGLRPGDKVRLKEGGPG